MKPLKYAKNLLSALSGKPTYIVNARYDAAQTTTGNSAHWSMATSLDADAENSPGIRRTIRNRARYESANNPWLDGLVSSRAADVIGTRPRLQLRESGLDNADAAERDFMDWARKIHLGQKLRTALQAKVRDGEVFIILTSNPSLNHRVKLDLRVIEADRVSSPMGMVDKNNIDGVLLDDAGNVTAYEILKSHPGANGVFTSLEKNTVNAEYVIHLFNKVRPEQHRGISELTSALPLIALLRRYMLAMVQKMETSANIVGMLENDADYAPDAGDPSPFEVLEVPRNGMVTLPGGSKFTQANLGTPSDSQNEFATQVKIETARALKMPRNAALGDSSGYNYASGRLDWQGYSKIINVERAEIEEVALDVILRHFFAEYYPGRRTYDASPDHTWYWDGREHVDPLKEANAALNLVEGGLETAENYFARQGRDWQSELKQRLIEEKFEAEERARLGLPPKDGVKARFEDHKDESEENNAEKL